ncbi:MAG: RCC1 domain-containing protein [Myxococcota bacterium]
MKCWGGEDAPIEGQSGFRLHEFASEVVLLGMGAQRACALTSDGCLYCWEDAGGDLGFPNRITCGL